MYDTVQAKCFYSVLVHTVDVNFQHFAIVAAWFYNMSEGRRGHQKFRLTNRKNYEQKKAARKRAAVNVGNVTTEECLVEPSSLPLAVPLTLYTDQTLSSLNVLSRRLHRMESINEGLGIYSSLPPYIYGYLE